MSLLVSAIERPWTNEFGAESCPTPHERAAALLHSVARKHAPIDGDKRTARLAMRVFLRFTGVSASTVPPPVRIGRPFAEWVAQNDVGASGRLSACAGADRSVECAAPGAPGPRRVPRSR